MKNPTNSLSSRGGLWLAVGGVVFTLTMCVVFAQSMQTQQATAVGQVVAERNNLGQTKDNDITRLIRVIDEQNELLRAAGKAPVPAPTVAPPATPIQQVAPPVVGQQGPQGDQGPRGYTGETGPRGPAGPSGPAGVPGSPGPVGPKGPRGDEGSEGPKGDQGIAGELGPTGEKGDKGEQGDQGPKGDPGPKGDQGDPGPKGDPGTKGDNGKTGEQGRGIADNGVKCVDGTWQITYTDGAVDSNAGSCAP